MDAARLRGVRRRVDHRLGRLRRRPDRHGDAGRTFRKPRRPHAEDAQEAVGDGLQDRVGLPRVQRHQLRRSVDRRNRVGERARRLHRVEAVRLGRVARVVRDVRHRRHRRQVTVGERAVLRLPAVGGIDGGRQVDAVGEVGAVARSRTRLREVVDEPVGKAVHVVLGKVVDEAQHSRRVRFPVDAAHAQDRLALPEGVQLRALQGVGDRAVHEDKLEGVRQQGAEFVRRLRFVRRIRVDLDFRHLVLTRHRAGSHVRRHARPEIALAARRERAVEGGDPQRGARHRDVPNDRHDVVVVVGDHRDDLVDDLGKVGAAAHRRLRVDLREGVPAVARARPAHEDAHTLDAVRIEAVAGRDDRMALDAHAHGHARAALVVDELLQLFLRRVLLIAQPHAARVAEAEDVLQGRHDAAHHRSRLVVRPHHAHADARIVGDAADQLLLFRRERRRGRVRAAPVLRQDRPVDRPTHRLRLVGFAIVGAGVVLKPRNRVRRAVELRERRARRRDAAAHGMVRRVEVVEVGPVVGRLVPVRERALLLEALDDAHFDDLLCGDAGRLRPERRDFRQARPLRLARRTPRLRHVGCVVAVCGRGRRRGGGAAQRACGALLRIEAEELETPPHVAPQNALQRMRLREDAGIVVERHHNGLDLGDRRDDEHAAARHRDLVPQDDAGCGIAFGDDVGRPLPRAERPVPRSPCIRRRHRLFGRHRLRAGAKSQRHREEHQNDLFHAFSTVTNETVPGEV